MLHCFGVVGVGEHIEWKLLPLPSPTPRECILPFLSPPPVAINELSVFTQSALKGLIYFSGAQMNSTIA